MTDEKFECVYVKYRNMVMKTAYEILKDYHLAQDVCQEVFIKLTDERMEKLSTEDDIRRYLDSVACHRAIDYYRKLRRINEVFLEDEEDTACDSDMDEKLGRKVFMEDMFRELEAKNPEWKMIVLRVGLYDEMPDMVARDMGISAELVRTKYHRAKIWIRKRFEEEYRLLKDL